MDSLQTPDTLQTSGPEKSFPSKQIVHLVIQLVALAFLLNFCFNVLSPFINPLVWAAIFAVALYPFHQRVKKWFKGRGTLAAVVVTILMLTLFVAPGILFSIKTGTQAKELFTDYRAGKVTIPHPGENVKNWPLIGGKAYDIWDNASTDLNAFVQENPERVKTITVKLVDLIKSTEKVYCC
jgi:predicted PurR-regulated permease PerM